MPGIYGYVKKTSSGQSELINMTKAMHLYDHFVLDTAFEDIWISGSRVHLGHIGEKDSPYVRNEVYIWIEGEAYNHLEVARDLGLKESGFAQTLAEAYTVGKLDCYLNKLDGYFCAAIYDSTRKKVHLITDRYGMRLLYWYCQEGLFAWSSEVKGILALKDVNKELDQSSYPCFMNLGYLMGEHTWFEHIRLIKPAIVLEYDIESKKIAQHHYWKWSEIKPSTMGFDEAIYELGQRFLAAVEKRFNPNEKIGVSLSGGLDSRAIFAAVNHLYPGYKGYAYTFGIPGCDDIKIAEQVVAKSKWRHVKFYFDSANWFEPRIEKIWDTDGMLDMMHMHGSEFLGEISENIEINLNGYCGDAILGGGFLSKIPHNVRINAKNSRSFYRHFFSMADIENEFYDIDHVEPNIYVNRVRRFTNIGTVNLLTSISQRKPFFDNNIVAFVFSLPDEYRVNNKIYSAMLQRFFSQFFKSIPWQKTGEPAGVINNSSITYRALNKGEQAIIRLLSLKTSKDYTEYPEWIRNPEVSQALADILTPKNAEYVRLTGENLKNKYLQTHLSWPYINKSNEILRAATIELYLSQVFRKHNKKVPSKKKEAPS
ncbi:MAG: asparagine synthase-related protein [Desulfobulbaceae bacterium]|nr:asparagine synthase-related protein [Desulfobulbaceae bacterium]